MKEHDFCYADLRVKKPAVACDLPTVCFSVLDGKPLVINDDNEKFFVEKYEKRNDNYWKDLALQLKIVREQLRALQDEEEEIKELLIAASNGINSIGGGVQLEKVKKKGSIDYSRIDHLKEVDLEQYRRDSIEYWKVSII